MKKAAKITKRDYMIPSLYALIFLIGVVGIFAVTLGMEDKLDSLGYSGELTPVFYDNFELFKNISIVLWRAFLMLTVISVPTDAISGRKSPKLAKAVAKTAPYLCAVLLVCIGVFFAYLTSGGEYSIVPDVILLSVFEALTFALPISVGGFIRLIAKKQKETDLR